jgi:type III secretory pathway component EscV
LKNIRNRNDLSKYIKANSTKARLINLMSNFFHPRQYASLGVEENKIIFDVMSKEYRDWWSESLNAEKLIIICGILGRRFDRATTSLFFLKNIFNQFHQRFLVLINGFFENWCVDNLCEIFDDFLIARKNIAIFLKKNP